MLEVQLVNSVAPFLLNSRLKPLLMRSPFARRFVVNVSAMEGQFQRHKTVFHPHTNMAKAALNMMTRTAGDDYAQDQHLHDQRGHGLGHGREPHAQARAGARNRAAFSPPSTSWTAWPASTTPSRRASTATKRLFMACSSKTTRPARGKNGKELRAVRKDVYCVSDPRRFLNMMLAPFYLRSMLSAV